VVGGAAGAIAGAGALSAETVWTGKVPRMPGRAPGGGGNGVGSLAAMAEARPTATGAVAAGATAAGATAGDGAATATGVGAAAAHWGGTVFACGAVVTSEPSAELWITRGRTVMVFTGIG